MIYSVLIVVTGIALLIKYVQITTVYSLFNMIFLEEKRIRATFEWNRVCFLHFSFKKDAVPGLRIETRIRTEVRIRAPALAPVP